MENRITENNRTTDWKFDFSSLPKWDVRERIPFVYDKFYHLSQSDTLCCIYSIAEVRMGWHQGFLAILKNKEKPELVLNINKKMSFSDNFSASKNGNLVFLLSHFADKTAGGIGSMILIIDIVSEKFSYLRINNYNPCYKIVELGDGVFGIESDEMQRITDKRLDGFSKTIIDLSCLDWLDFNEIDVLYERISLC